MDKIFLNKLEFYGYHGVLPEESRLGQRFYVDLILECNLSEAATSDNVDYTINYAQVYEVVKSIVEGERKQLIETVAERIAGQLLQQFDRLQKCTVKVTKPNPPIHGHYDSVGVEITRVKQ